MFFSRIHFSTISAERNLSLNKIQLKYYNSMNGNHTSILNTRMAPPAHQLWHAVFSARHRFLAPLEVLNLDCFPQLPANYFQSLGISFISRVTEPANLKTVPRHARKEFIKYAAVKKHAYLNRLRLGRKSNRYFSLIFGMLLFFFFLAFLNRLFKNDAVCTMRKNSFSKF